MSTLLVTGSSGLIGSEVVDYFCQRGWEVHGIDNNMRADFLDHRVTHGGTSKGSFPLMPASITMRSTFGTVRRYILPLKAFGLRLWCTRLPSRAMISRHPDRLTILT
jgi:nucleoside-diphosphate-sugar epimerase